MILANKYMHVLQTREQKGMYIAQHIYPSRVDTHVVVTDGEEAKGVWI